MWSKPRQLCSDIVVTGFGFSRWLFISLLLYSHKLHLLKNFSHMPVCRRIFLICPFVKHLISDQNPSAVEVPYTNTTDHALSLPGVEVLPAAAPGSQQKLYSQRSFVGDNLLTMNNCVFVTVPGNIDKYFFVKQSRTFPANSDQKRIHWRCLSLLVEIVVLLELSWSGWQRLQTY